MHINELNEILNKFLENENLNDNFWTWFGNSKIVDENGNPLVCYHGTPNGTFNSFKPLSHFTQSKKYADIYQNTGASSISVKQTADNPTTYEVYLSIQNPFDTRNSKERKIFLQEYQAYYSPELTSKGLVDWMEVEDLAEWLQENHPEYDGIIADEGGTGGYGDKVQDRGVTFVPFNPNQIKSIKNNGNWSSSENIYEDNNINDNFKKWFGNSKVADENGNPKIVYHGTNSNFSKFNDKKIGSHTDKGMYGRGFYFMDDSNQTYKYGRKTLKVYLRIENPLRLGRDGEFDDIHVYANRKAGIPDVLNSENYDKYAHLIPSVEQVTQYIKEDGYDGIIVVPFNGAETEYIVFNPNQIKSVNNNGDWSNSENIYENFYLHEFSMKPKKDLSFSEFYDWCFENKKNPQLSRYYYSIVNNKIGIPAGKIIHGKNEHNNSKQTWEAFVNNYDKCQLVVKSKDKMDFDNDVYLMLYEISGKYYGAAVADCKKRYYLTTWFTDSKNNILNWLQQKGESQPEVPTATNVPGFPLSDGFSNNIITKENKKVTPSKCFYENSNINNNFWKWFNGSITVDENGNPLIFYHGTKQKFDTFKAKYDDGLIFFAYDEQFAKDWAESAPLTQEQQDIDLELEDKRRPFGNAVYKKLSKTYGDEYSDEKYKEARKRIDRYEKRLQRQAGIDPKVMPVYIKAKKIFIPEKDYNLVLDDIIKYYEWVDPNTEEFKQRLQTQEDNFKKVNKEESEWIQNNKTKPDEEIKQHEHNIDVAFKKLQMCKSIKTDYEDHLKRIQSGAWIYFEHPPIINKIFDELGYDAIQLSESKGIPTTLAVRQGTDQIKSIFNNGQWSNSSNIYERFEEIERGVFATNSAYDVINRMKNKPQAYRMIWDKNIGFYFIADAFDYIHQDIVEHAFYNGFYPNMVSAGECDDYMNRCMEEQSMILFAFDPDGGSLLDTEKSSDGYTRKYVYDFGTIYAHEFTPLEKCPLYDLLGEPIEKEDVFEDFKSLNEQLEKFLIQEMAIINDRVEVNNEDVTNSKGEIKEKFAHFHWIYKRKIHFKFSNRIPKNTTELKKLIAFKNEANKVKNNELISILKDLKTIVSKGKYAGYDTYTAAKEFWISIHPNRDLNKELINLDI